CLFGWSFENDGYVKRQRRILHTLARRERDNERILRTLARRERDNERILHTLARRERGVP
ncbi:MAG: hypothetical protein ACI9QR_001816, partial [Flavobacteriaceae bacterium]